MASPDPGHDPPPGYHWAAVVSPDWRIEPGRRCRRMIAHYRYCRKPSAAALNRRYGDGSVRAEDWWAYCPEHMYRNWIEDGQVMRWILEADE